mgnify:CR=1 FL=1
MLAGIWAAVAIQCPRCHTMLFWKAVNEQPMGKWLDWLMTLERCPTCQSGGPNDP